MTLSNLVFFVCLLGFFIGLVKMYTIVRQGQSALIEEIQEVHSVVNSRLTAALNRIENLRDEISGLKHEAKSND